MHLSVAQDVAHQEKGLSHPNVAGAIPGASFPATRGRSAGDFAQTLGWLSLGLGIAGLMMPRTLARWAGLAPRDTWLRAIGAREFITGAGILLRPDKPGWLWSRVAGDAMDLSLMALAPRHRSDRRSGMVSALLTGITVLDLLVAYDKTADKTARLHSEPRATRKKSTAIVHVKRSLDINRSPEACYHFWRHFENFPRFMQHVESVKLVDTTHSRWQVHAPLRQHTHWEVELTSDIPGQQLGWQTRAGSATSDISHTGIVHFRPAPGRRGTRIEAELTYHLLRGMAGLVRARMTEEALTRSLSNDLRRFKQLIETGEIATTIGQAAGRRSTIDRLVHKGPSG